MQPKYNRLFRLGILWLVLLFGCTQQPAQPQELTASPPVSHRPLIQDAETAYNAGEFARALALAQQAVAASPGDATAWEWVRRSVVAQSGDDYLSHLPADRYRMTPEEFVTERVNGKEYFLVDVREPDEFVQGHIQGAVNIPLRELMTHLNELPQTASAPLMLYCHSQKRSTHALVILREVGFTQVFHLEGGYVAYQEYIESQPLPTPGPTPTLDPAQDPDKDGGC